MAQEKRLQVCIGEAGIAVGTLWLSEQGGRHYSVFQYDQHWLGHPQRFAICPDLPLTEERAFFHGEPGVLHASSLPPALADTVPDAWGRHLLGQFHNNASLGEFDYLVAVDDVSRMGAMRLREGDGNPFLAQTPADRPAIPPIIEIQNLIKDIHRIEQGHPDREALQRLLGAGSSLGGARPKCTVINEDGTLAIAKFTSRYDTRPVEKAEVLALRLAQQCGMRTPRVRLLESNGFPVAVIDRFDRKGAGRIPYLSAQSFMGLPSAVGGSYVDLADRLRKYALSPERELMELFKRISYTILISNTDDHLKNHGVLYDGRGGWILSPIFDVNPAPERHRTLKTAIADITQTDASVDVLLDYSEFFGIKKDDASQIVFSQADNIHKNWVNVAKECSMTPREIQEYAPAFEHDEIRKALDLGRSVSAIIPYRAPQSNDQKKAKHAEP